MFLGMFPRPEHEVWEHPISNSSWKSEKNPTSPFKNELHYPPTPSGRDLGARILALSVWKRTRGRGCCRRIQTIWTDLGTVCHWAESRVEIGDFWSYILDIPCAFVGWYPPVQDNAEYRDSKPSSTLPGRDLVCQQRFLDDNTDEP